MITKFFIPLTLIVSVSTSLSAMSLTLPNDTLLTTAIRNGDSQEIFRLVKTGADVNAMIALCYTPLMLAAALGQREAVLLLLQQAATNVTAKDLCGRTAFFDAAEKGQLDILKDMLASDHKDRIQTIINKPREDFKKTPLMAAVENGHLEVVKFLLSLPGIEVNARDIGGQTALILALNAKNNSVEILRELLKANGVIINAKDNKEQTVLMIAEKRKLDDAVELLLRATALAALTRA